MSGQHVDITEQLLEEFELCGRLLDRMDEQVLGSGVRILGVDLVARLLAGYAQAVADPLQSAAVAIEDVPATVPSTPALPRASIGRSRIEQFILDHCRQAYDAVESLIRELDWRLEPAVFGEVEFRPGPWGIAITRVGRLDRCEWAAGRASAALRLWWVEQEANDPFAAAVSTHSGQPVRVEVDTERLSRLDACRSGPSAAGRWRAGYLVEPDSGSADPRREVVSLRWDPPTGGRAASAPPTPAGLVREGFVAEAWVLASRSGFSAEEEVALQMLITSKMRMMLEDDEPRHGFGVSVDDVVRCQGELDARQLSLCEHVQKLFFN